MIRYSSKTGRPIARFCNASCRDGLASDRSCGAIYPATFTPEGAYSAEAWSLRSATCAYCNARTGRPMANIAPTWPNHVKVGAS